MSVDPNPEAVFDVLCSDHAREILVAAGTEPRSAEELAEACDTSLPTVYRRVNALVEQGLLEEELQVDPEGNHYNRYVSTVEGLRFEIEETGFVASLDLKRDIVDQFGAFWRDLGDPGDGETDPR